MTVTCVTFETAISEAPLRVSAELVQVVTDYVIANLNLKEGLLKWWKDSEYE